MNYLETLSKPEKEAFFKASQEARKKKAKEQKDHATSSYKLKFLDKPHWEKLASEYGVKLPAWYLPPSSKYIKRYLKKLGKDASWFKEIQGISKVDEWAQMNPTWPLFACVGLMLEDVDQE